MNSAIRTFGNVGGITETPVGLEQGGVVLPREYRKHYTSNLGDVTGAYVANGATSTFLTISNLPFTPKTVTMYGDSFRILESEGSFFSTSAGGVIYSADATLGTLTYSVGNFSTVPGITVTLTANGVTIEWLNNLSSPNRAARVINCRIMVTQ